MQIVALNTTIPYKHFGSMLPLFCGCLLVLCFSSLEIAVVTGGWGGCWQTGHFAGCKLQLVISGVRNDNIDLLTGAFGRANSDVKIHRF